MNLNQLRKREAYRRGIIAHQYLKPFQWPLYNLINQNTKDPIVPNTTRRFGKSTVCVVFCVEEALKSKCHTRYATAFLTDLENFIEPVFDSVLEECPEDVRPKWHAAKKVWRFNNGSTIKLVGLDKNPNGIRGNAIDILVIDEAAFVSNLEYLYKSIIIPATMNRKFKLVFPSTPPVSPEHYWARELVVKAKLAGTYQEITIDAIADLEPEEKKRLLDEVGGENSSTAQREFYCKIVVDETRAVAPSFKHALHVGEVNQDYVRWVYVGDSGGIRDRTSILKVGWCHTLQKILIKSELNCDAKTPTPVMAKQFKEWSGTDEMIFDSHGQTRVDLAAFGLKVAMPMKDDFTAGLQMLNAVLYNNQILIDTSCQTLIATLTSGLLTTNKNDYERTEALGHCDAVAALIYAIRSVDKVTDLRPPPPKEQTWHVPKANLNKAILQAFS